MNKSLITLAAVAAFSGAVFAQDADPSGQFALQIQSSRTRADVQAEAVAAVARGALRPSNPHASASVQPVLNSSTTRSDVVAQFLADREEATAMVAEDSGSSYLARAGAVHNVHEYLAANR
ncbi:MAG TPA: DUF4148 domain-containing protein [Ramlibacter sp.]|nr:DUF4148 domain-containing protein [Ramlibacter sp.]